MARLFECKGKELLKNAGVAVPRGETATTPDQAQAAAARLGGAVAVKAQVWTTGRFKAGAIQFADTPDEARAQAEHLLGRDIKGFKVDTLLIEEKLDIDREFYAGIIIDNSHKVRAPVVMFSAEGGVDVESVAPEKIARAVVDVFQGLTRAQAQTLVRTLGLDKALGASVADALADTLLKLYETFRQADARSAEINPLVVTRDGRVMAADCRISIDDASVARHPELGIVVPRESNTAPTDLDLIGWKIEEKDYRGSSFFAQMAEDLSEGGYIAYHAIGGGGALLAADTLVRQGLKLANFAETSGNPPASKVYRTARVALSQPGLDGYCLMGAVIASQDQWHHAHGLVKAFREALTDKPGFPVLVLIAGNKEEEALAILREGVQDLPIQLELYDRTHIHRLSGVAARMKEMVDEYRASKKDARSEPARPAPAAVAGGERTTRYDFTTGSISIDESRCDACTTLACVKACSLYNGTLYRVRNGRRALGIPIEEMPRRCTECVACEYECQTRGEKALTITLPIEGLTHGYTAE